MTPPPGPLSVFLTSLPGGFADAVRRAAALGFTHVDVVALADRPPGDLEALADSGLAVQCAPLGRARVARGAPRGRRPPPGQPLAAPAGPARRAAVDTVRRHLDDAARL